ncbi:MAG: hypothetical protein AAB887_01280 [Patescibacteria group bacterium]
MNDIERVALIVPRKGDEVMVEVGINPEDGSPWFEFLNILGIKNGKARLSLGPDASLIVDINRVEVVRKARSLKPRRWR